MRSGLAGALRRAADRIDHAGAPKITHWSFTFEGGRGIVFRDDGRGCPVAYLGDGQYERAHTEAGLSCHDGGMSEIARVVIRTEHADGSVREYSALRPEGAVLTFTADGIEAQAPGREPLTFTVLEIPART